MSSADATASFQLAHAIQLEAQVGEGASVAADSSSAISDGNTSKENDKADEGSSSTSASCTSSAPDGRDHVCLTSCHTQQKNASAAGQQQHPWQQIERAHDATTTTKNGSKRGVHDCRMTSPGRAAADTAAEAELENRILSVTKANIANQNKQQSDHSAKQPTDVPYSLATQNPPCQPVASSSRHIDRTRQDINSNAITSQKPQCDRNDSNIEETTYEQKKDSKFPHGTTAQPEVSTNMNSHNSSIPACGLKPPRPEPCNLRPQSARRHMNPDTPFRADRSISVTNPPDHDIERRSMLKRKLSVFSHDGFPNARPLDESSFKSRSTSTVSNPASQGERKASESTTSGFSDNTSTSSGSQSNTATIKNVPINDRASAINLNNRRSVRSDTLGSTGSSRASSCDEPAIMALNSSAPNFASSLIANKAKQFQHQHQNSMCGPTCMSVSNSSLESITLAQQDHKEPVAPIDREDGASDETKNTIEVDGDSSDGQSICNEPSSTASAGNFKPLSQTVVSPFESIKEKLKDKSTPPNAQMIQNHIDSLISQNEAIVDNWNLVSIRSYNSSRDATSAVPSPCPIAVKRSSFCHLPFNAGSEKCPSSNLCNAGGHQRLKRWSTTALGTPNRPSTPRTMAAHENSLIELRQLHSRRECEQNVDDSTLGQEGLKQEITQPLESAIQNLSLKRSSETTNLKPEASFQATNFATNLSAIESPSRLHPLHEERLQQHSLQELHSPYSHLLLDHLHGANRGSSKSEMAMASLLLERQRQLLTGGYQVRDEPPRDRTNELACLQREQQQQYVIEQQIEQMKLNQLAMASLNQQMQHQSLGMLAPILDPMRHLHLHHPLSHLADASTWAPQRNDFLAAQPPSGDQLSEMMKKNNEAVRSGLPPGRQHRHTVSGQHLHVMEHTGEMFTQSLDSAKPIHRCEVCDVSFWTRDLLNYHRLTQCTSNSSSSDAGRQEGGNSLQQHIPSLAFNFSGQGQVEYPPMSFRFHHSLSKSASPQRPANLSNRDEEPRRKISGCNFERQMTTNEIASGASDKLNLTARQGADPIGTVNQISMRNHGSLPFKKRKISEPNMRLRQ